MVDSLGYRRKFGVIAPSTNTSVQPEFDSFRPVGVPEASTRRQSPQFGWGFALAAGGLLPIWRSDQQLSRNGKHPQFSPEDPTGDGREKPGRFM